ncbi:hypothetical protein NQ015_08615 [Corynebacterium sp. 153RC1]|uniref:hypothetical protein n=1 Tax=unclassified Corynebacterium TaxID=2624378 RepID=UPI00211CA652|nr:MULTISPECIES: hypothetical protein [unclassified Corynebacterium]MCQ9353043.1 hypothetical protein [Corynebacterium sp. 209RC1]MCQ9355247.1 hypothetical protein [Corynebacterium sp. 1222RC1]MCQ9357579.1 hypothetical protein [Corynebacterium sp. 122RC1]MCQ9359156.1 hypothetical protein [Corynebacterium sp. 142RC1]MCQ9361824.1 hypothetical protein [Corynebacterium sp. 153RC1]
MDFLRNPLTATEANFILNALPSSRRKTYLDLANEHSRNSQEINLLAATLYVWNGYVASAVDRATGEVEIMLRNLIDKSFSTWNSAYPRSGSTEWILHPEGVLKDLVWPSGQKKLQHYADIRKESTAPTHDDYVAGLTFGNWVHLLPRNHATDRNSRVILWKEAIEPNTSAMNMRSFQSAAMQVKNMRNRATHRRPIIKDINLLQSTHGNCIEIAKAIDPAVGTWLRNQRWIPDALAKNPLKNK